VNDKSLTEQRLTRLLGYPEKFAVLFASEGTGGEERYLVELCIAMQKTSSKPILLNLKTKTPYQANLEQQGVQLLSGIMPWRFDVMGAFRLFRMVRKLAPDVLLVNSNKQSIWVGTVVGRLCRVPLVLIHTHDHLGTYAFTLRMGSHLGDCVVAAARKHREDLCIKQGLREAKVVTVFPGINLVRTVRAQTASKISSKQRKRVIGIIAGLRPEKDHDTFLRAASIVLQRIQNVEFHIIGDGPQRPHLERLATDLGVSASTRFLGWQDINGRLFETLDVLALSSLSETFPAVLLEAFSAGVPVVATNVGAVEELFGSPSCGLLVPPSDPSALGSALMKILEAPEVARTLVSQAQDRAKFFSADRFCADMLDLTRDMYHKKYGAVRN
jgi:glycosyltransferase involved in cell wall biosynthesis